MGLIIKITGIEEAKEFREWLHKFKNYGIDDACDIIEKSIKSKNTSNIFILSHDVMNSNEKL